VRLLFIVDDTGIGIPADQLEWIFESFSQVGTSTHIKYGGTGLGLAISRDLVKLMHGRIWVESKLGEGSTFCFTAEFGLTQEELLTYHKAVPAKTAIPVTALSILLAEDNRLNQILAVELLERRGHSVTVAGSGVEALEKLKAKRFDVVLMDVRMPEMDGVEATRRIREGEAGEGSRRVPVVALTAHALTGDRERFLAAGMDDYVAKPIDLEELDEVLRRIAAERTGTAGEEQ
jgi:CheY-like chemotaxis protein